MSPEVKLHPEWQDGQPHWRGATGCRHVRKSLTFKSFEKPIIICLASLTASWQMSLCQRVSKRVSKWLARKAPGRQAHVRCSNAITISCLNSTGENVNLYKKGLLITVSTVQILIIKPSPWCFWILLTSHYHNLQSLLTNNQRWPLRVRKKQSTFFALYSLIKLLFK